MAKMNKTWVVLCSTAVAAVYATGYFSTEAQANKLDMQQNAQVHFQTKANTVAFNSNQTNGKSSISSAPSQQGQVKINQAKAAAPKVVQPKRVYKDGTFTGMGQNRRGTISVAVTIKNDKITDVSISDFEMHYSESDIVGLPHEVLKKQNAQVDNVTGATYSTMAFQDAVQEALYQAKNA